MKTDSIPPENMPDHLTGLEIIRALNLRVIRSGDQKGRVETDGGTKTPVGLARTIRAILEKQN